MCIAHTILIANLFDCEKNEGKNGISARFTINYTLWQLKKTTLHKSGWIRQKWISLEMNYFDDLVGKYFQVFYDHQRKNLTTPKTIPIQKSKFGIDLSKRGGPSMLSITLTEFWHQNIDFNLNLHFHRILASLFRQSDNHHRYWTKKFLFIQWSFTSQWFWPTEEITEIQRIIQYGFWFGCHGILTLVCVTRTLRELAHCDAINENLEFSNNKPVNVSCVS